MKILCTLFVALCGMLPLSAETITAHYYGSEIDLTQKFNPCKGNTMGGVEVIVVTNVTAVKKSKCRDKDQYDTKWTLPWQCAVKSIFY